MCVNTSVVHRSDFAFTWPFWPPAGGHERASARDGGVESNLSNRYNDRSGVAPGPQNTPRSTPTPPVRRHVCCDGHFPCTRPSRRHDARGRDTLSRDAGTPPTCPRTIWDGPSAAKWPVTQVPTRVSNAKVPPKCSFRQQRRSTTHAVQRWAVAWVWRLSLLLNYARSEALIRA